MEIFDCIQKLKDRIDGLKDGSYSIEGLENKKWTQKEIAEELHITESALSKWLHGQRTLQIDEAVAMSKLFHISCDELLTGEKPEYRQISDEYGLNTKSQEWLLKNTQENKELISVLNIILNDDKIANVLFRSILIYACAIQVKIVPLVQQEKEEFIYVDNDTSDDMMKMLATQNIQRLLEYTREAWDEAIRRRTKITIPEKYLKTETEKRVRTKKKQQVTQMDFIRIQAEIENELEEKRKMMDKFRCMKELLNPKQED